MPKVVIKPNESQQQLFRRFRKEVTQSGVMSAVRQRRWFISRAERRRIEKKKAIRRQHRKSLNRRNRKNN